jgi:hypothetical protein
MAAKYCIRVRGVVDKAWSDYFGHLAIAVPDEEHQPDVTTLTGQLPDEAALVGILYRLYSLGFELLSVEKVAAIAAVFVGAALIGYSFARVAAATSL